MPVRPRPDQAERERGSQWYAGGARMKNGDEMIYDLAFGRLAGFLGAGLVCLMLAGPLQAQETPATGMESESATTAPLSDETSGMVEDGALTQDASEDGFDMTTPDAEAELVLPHDLSPWGMFMQADIVVKVVMIGLIFASFVTWTIWFAKRMEISGARRRAKAAFQTLASASSLDEASTSLAKSKGPVTLLAGAATQEVQASGDNPEKEGVKERIAWRFQRIEANAAREIGAGTGVLATIGATAPFVGLFGTVWGIMNSFIGIAQTQTTNLAVVAPGIAEALLATGLGLVAAIPAVVIYNSFSRSIAGYRALIADSSAELLRLVSRDLDLGRRSRLAKAAD